MSQKMVARTSLIIFLLSIVNIAHGAACSTISRTNNAANAILTSAKYNSDNNTAYGAINGIIQADCTIDADFITDQTITTSKYQDNSVSEDKIADSILAKLNPVGVIVQFVGSVAPSGYFVCDGSEVSRSTYSDLYAVIGDSYGDGDGSTTFNLPDFRGGFIRGYVGWDSDDFETTDVDIGTETITISGGHSINRTGFPVRFSSTTTLPTGISANTTYWAIYVSSTQFKIASSRSNAISGTPIDLTSVGSGTHTVSQWADHEAGSRVASTDGGNAGNSLGAYQDDAFQSHKHQLREGVTTPGGGGAAYTWVHSGFGFSSNPTNMSTPVNDGVGGVSRTSTETRPANYLVNYLIKY